MQPRVALLLTGILLLSAVPIATPYVDHILGWEWRPWGVRAQGSGNNSTEPNQTEPNQTDPNGTSPGTNQTGTGNGTGLPDLRPLDITPRNLTVRPDAVLTVRVVNQGDNASAPVNVTFRIDGQPQGNATLPALAAGAEGQASSSPWNATLGTHQVRVEVDVDNATSEADEANNVLETTVNVTERPPSLPDLMVLDVAPSVADAQVGTNTTFKARILNSGGGDAANFTVRFVLDDAEFDTAPVPSLAAGAGATLESRGWNATAGNHTLKAVVDAGGAVDEAQEDNNDFTHTFTIGAARQTGPDVRVSSVLIEPESPTADQRVVFVALLENAGADAGPFDVTFSLDNTTLGNATQVTGLAAGALHRVTSSNWTAVPGEHRLVVEADTDHLNDTAQLNNLLRFDFTVPGADRRPDLIVALLTVPNRVDTGQPIRVLALVRNNGTWPSPPTEVGFSVDGTPHNATRVDALVPGAEASVASPVWNATRGTHELAARVDPMDVVPELNETNNVARLQVTIPFGGVNRSELPDLTIDTITWEPAQPKAGDDVVITATVVNKGNDTVAGAFTVAFLVDGSPLDSATTKGLGDGPLKLVSRPWKATPGKHTLRVEVDPEGTVQEREEGNNLAFAVVDVPVGGVFTRPVPALPPVLLLAALPLVAWALRRRR